MTDWTDWADWTGGTLDGLHGRVASVFLLRLEKAPARERSSSTEAPKVHPEGPMTFSKTEAPQGRTTTNGGGIRSPLVFINIDSFLKNLPPPCPPIDAMLTASENQKFLHPLSLVRLHVNIALMGARGADKLSMLILTRGGGQSSVQQHGKGNDWRSFLQKWVWEEGGEEGGR